MTRRGEDKHPLMGQSLLAKHDTWLTRVPLEHSKLLAEEKLFVSRGSAWEWSKIIITAGEQLREVRLASSPDTPWYFYAPHWKIINDEEEKISFNPKHHIQLNAPYTKKLLDEDKTFFTSACFTVLDTVKPCETSCDDFADLILENGEPTEAWVQLKTLDQCGLHAEFRQDGNWDDVDDLLVAGVPVPMGILHHGPYENPTGTGHWIVAVGATKDRESLIVHDPLGDLDLVEGVYISEHGAFQKYSKRYLESRWMVEKGYSSGWYIKVKQ